MTDAAIWAKALSLVSIVFVVYLLTMWAVLVFWTHRDIASRTADRTQRTTAVALVALFNAPGLLLYLALRPPETSAELLARQLEAEALVQDMEQQHACPGCGHALGSEFITCPYCRTTVQTSCADCSRALRSPWVLCPYCGADRREAPAAGIADRPQRQPEPAREILRPAPARRTLLPIAKV